MEKRSRHAWLSSEPLAKENLQERCDLGARHRWAIEEAILVKKHQGYHYEHLFSFNWNAMKGYHYLMHLGHALNVLAQYIRRYLADHFRIQAGGCEMLPARVRLSTWATCADDTSRTFAMSQLLRGVDSASAHAANRRAGLPKRPRRAFVSSSSSTPVTFTSAAVRSSIETYCTLPLESSSTNSDCSPEENYPASSEESNPSCHALMGNRLRRFFKGRS